MGVVDNNVNFDHNVRTKRDFGDERFHYFMFLVCVQCVINFIVAKSSELVNTIVTFITCR